MELRALACGSCGAPLQIPIELRFVNCNHCGSTLEIKHNADVTYSEKIDQIATRTVVVDKKLDDLKLDHELGDLRREWQVKHESERVTDKLLELELSRRIEEIDNSWKNQCEEFFKANRSGASSRAVLLIAGVLVSLVGIVLGISVISEIRFLRAFELIAVLPCLMFIVLGVLAIQSSVKKPRAFELAERGYLSHRREVEQELDALREKHSAH